MKDESSSSSNPAPADPPLQLSASLDPANPQLFFESAVAFLYDNSNLFSDYSSGEMRYESIVDAVIEKKKQKGKAEMTESEAEQSQGTKRYKPQSNLPDEVSSPNPAAAAAEDSVISFSEVMDPDNPPRLLKSALKFVHENSILHDEFCSLEMLNTMMYAVMDKAEKNNEASSSSNSVAAAAAEDPPSFSAVLDPYNPRPFLESAIQFLYNNSGSEMIISMGFAEFEESK